MTLRDLPSVDALSRSERLRSFSPTIQVEASRAAVDELRRLVLAGREPGSPDELAYLHAQRLTEASLRAAINASGVILHTGLGRARLAAEAIRQINEAASSHAVVELDLQDGRRGDRQMHVREMICRLTGAEDALVVNNCAAAVFLSLAATSSGREVVLSRGQMVEIGGAFRMPDVVRQSGCKLVEVGCTNKTRLSDYAEVMTDATAAILRCHPSNFKIVGFSEEPSLKELATLAHSREMLLIDDMGSGCLVDLSRYGLPREETTRERIEAGADLVLSSGDKLLGGPQAGIIVGTSNLIRAIKKHPLARAVRVDKLTLAALEATLRLYTSGRENEIPTLQYLGRSLAEIRPLAELLAAAWQGATVEEGLTEIGGGSLPGEGVPTWRVGLQSRDADDLAARLRRCTPPVIGRIEADKVWLDPRTMEEAEVRLVAEMLGGLA